MSINYSRGFFFTLIAQGSMPFLGLISSAIIVRKLGPENYGIYSLFVLLLGISKQVIDLRLGTANVYFYSTGQVDLKTLVKISLVSGLILGFPATFSLYYILNNTSALCTISKSVLLLAAIALPFFVVENYFFGLLRAQGRFGVNNLIKLLAPALRIALIFIVAFPLNRLGVNELGIIDSIIGILFFLVAYLCVTEHVNYKEVDIKDQRARATAFWWKVYQVHRYGIWTTFNFIALMLYGRVDSVIIAKFLGTTELGYYTIAVKTSEILFLFVHSIQNVLMPRLSRNRTNETAHFTALVHRTLLPFILMMGIILLITGYFLIPVIYGADFIHSIPPFLILMIATTVYCMHKLLNPFYFATNQVKIILIYSVTTFTINSGLSITLVPIMGISGAAISTLISYLLVTSNLIWLFKSKNGLSLRELVLLKTADLLWIRKKLTRAFVAE